MPLSDQFRAALAAAPAADLRQLRSRVVVHAEDTGEAFALWVEDGEVRLEQGDETRGQIRILGDAAAIEMLTRVRLRPTDAALWNVLKRQLGGELTIRGLVLRLPQVVRLVRLLGQG